jgi:hypothetical protein
MDQENFDKLVGDVSKHFATPEALIASKDLTREQKLNLLRQWEYDLQLLQVATEENMTADNGSAGPGANAEKLRAIHKAAETLGAQCEPDKGGAAKTGTVVNQ